jgi:hypothetical protein
MGKSSRRSLLNEADTRAKLIDPKIKVAGWGESQIEREHYFVKRRAITKGRIYLVAEESRRREPRRVDYLWEEEPVGIKMLHLDTALRIFNRGNKAGRFEPLVKEVDSRSDSSWAGLDDPR